jgi:hypothetical protein
VAATARLHPDVELAAPLARESDRLGTRDDPHEPRG